MNKKLKSAIIAVVVLVLGYVGTYGVIRVTRSDTMAVGRRVVFPNDALASFYRPLSALDRALTGMESAVGNEATTPSGPDEVEK